MSNAALILAPFSCDTINTLRRTLPVTYESWTDTRKLYAPEELSERIDSENISILVIEADFVFSEVFHESSPLKLLGVCRNSLDHVDVEAATQQGVAVVNAPGRNTQAVAELTISLMLSLARGVPHLNKHIKDGAWESPVEPYISMQGVELEGKTLGLIGLGAIGRRVARLGTAFGMRVLAYDPYAGAPGMKITGARLDTLEKVLEQSDFLSVHTPGKP